MIRRKAAENLSVLGHSVLLGSIIVVAVLVAYLWFVPPKSLAAALGARSRRRGRRRPRFLVVAVLGFALNDSGITIPGMMFAAGGSCTSSRCAARGADDPARADVDAGEVVMGDRARPGVATQR